MSVREAGDLLIWVGAVAAALVALGAALHTFVVRPLRRFIQGEIREVTAPLQTSNSKTVGQYVEGSAATLTEIRDELQQTNKLALQNQVQILETARRLDQHLLRHG